MIRRTTHALLSLASGLALAGAVNASAQISTNLLSYTTFDPAAASPWGYPYLYGNNGYGYSEYNKEYYLPDDFEMTNAMWYFAFDLTDLWGLTGYGTGTGGPLFMVDTDPASFASAERGDYIFTFDARVEGLEPGQTSANAEMQVQFYMQGEEGEQKSLQVNLGFRPTAEWQTFRMTLDDGSLGDNTSDSFFATNHMNTTGVRFNVNFHEPHNQFGYDAGNELFVDNVKLELAASPPVTPVETFPVTMAEWNFDDKPVWSEYHFDWSQNDTHVTVTAGNNANGNDPNTMGVDGTSGWYVIVDNSAFAWDPPSWAGCGSGGNGPVDFSLFDSPDLAEYRVTFDARVEGLAWDRTSSTTVLQLHMDTPDGTFDPANLDGNADFVIRLDFPLTQVSADWQTYSFLLSKGGVGNGSKELFSQYHAAIDGFRTQWQIENAASYADWDYDADNTLVIDNFKLERLYKQLPAPQINAATAGNQIVLTWNAPSGSNVKLQSAAAVTGPFSDVADAVSGYGADMTGNARFFRLVQE